MSGAVSFVRVLVVDDQPLIRAGMRVMIEHTPDLELIGEAEDGEQAIVLATAHRPDVVLMDVRMPRLDGVAATAQVTALGETPRVLVLTTFDADEYVFAALKAGASAFLLKDAPPEQVLGAIRDVHRGDAVVAPSATRRLLGRFAAMQPPEGPAPEALSRLTEREREVLELIARGRSNGEIATGLVLSEATVKTHVGRILAKTGARDRVQLVVLAYETALVRPGS